MYRSRGCFSCISLRMSSGMRAGPACFRLTHHDMGPRLPYLRLEVPAEELLLQDPVPAVTHPLINTQNIAALTVKILTSGPSISQLVSTTSASALWDSDKWGGANGSHSRSPQMPGLSE